MENASKALLIAGGMLIAIILLSLMSYFFSTMGQRSSNIYAEFKESDVNEFNQKFLNFEGKVLTVQDVVTIVNLAKDNSSREMLPTEVKVYIEEDEYNEKSNKELNNFIKENISTKYVVENIEISNKLVKKVEIKQKN